METRPSRPVKRTQSQNSWCSSGTGDGHIPLRSRRRSRNSSGQPSDRRPVDVLARNLRDMHASGAASSPNSQQDDSSWCLEVDRPGGRKHGNACFNQMRFLVAILSGFAIGLMAFHRLGIATAVLKMVNQTHLYMEANPNATQQDYQDDEGPLRGGEFNWSNRIVAIILGWYMFSYTLPQVPITRLNAAIGCRLAIPFGLTLCSVSSLLTPVAAYWSWEWVVACRLLNGLGAAGILTGMLQLLENWMRYDELSLGLTFSTLVNTAMIAVCPLIAGELAAVHWSLAFTIPSYFTLGFCLLWLVLVTDEPETNWLISKRELDYLKSDGFDDEQQQPAQVETETGEEVSWLEILKVPSFYAYLAIWIINCSSNASFMFVLPTYIRQFLKISVAENGFYCFLIYSGSLLAVVWPHQVLKQMHRIGLSMTRGRLILQTASCLVMTATYIYVGLMHRFLLPLLFLNRCFMSTDIIIMGSVMSNYAKVGLSGTAFAVVNTVGNLSITLASPLIGRWLDYSDSSDWAWSVVLCSFGASQVLILLIFWLFIDSEPVKFERKKAGGERVCDCSRPR